MLMRPKSNNGFIKRMFKNNKKIHSLPERIAKLFFNMSKSRFRACSPYIVMEILKKNNLFYSSEQQDAHEFLMYLISALQTHLVDSPMESSSMINEGNWLTKLFVGQTCKKITCLNCLTETKTQETFSVFSIDSSKTTCVVDQLNRIMLPEYLKEENKFFCSSCNTLHEAETKLYFTRLPDVFAIQLNRFKLDNNKSHKSLSRVSFGTELKIKQTDLEISFDLYAVIVHIGVSADSGHYISLIKSNNQWFKCDDKIVEKMNESDLSFYFGAISPEHSNTFPDSTAYILLYQKK